MNVHAYFMRKIPNQWLYSIKTIRQMPTFKCLVYHYNTSWIKTTNKQMLRDQF